MKLRGLAAVALVSGAALAAGPVCAAQTMLIVPGVGYVLGDSLPPSPVVRRYYTPSVDIASGFYPGATPVVVDYPASIFGRGSVAGHVAAGARVLDAMIQSSPAPTVVAGHSQGSLVVDDVQRLLRTDPGAPAPDQLSFIVFADPMRGVVHTLFRDGGRVPVVGLFASTPVESRYDTVVVTNEYDFWGDFPDRPWNPLALANAVAGGVFVHSRASFTPSDIPPRNVAVSVNSSGATVTSYLVPAQRLPLTEPLRIAGVAGPVVDAVDRVLRPIVDAGYSRNDPPGSPRPYLRHGAIRTATTPAGAAARAAPRMKTPGRHTDRRGRHSGRPAA